MSSIGTILRDRYEIITELGRGGMSTVYLAQDKNLGSYWAVKQVKRNSNVDIQVFKKEVELLSSLNYPDIPRIVDRIEIRDDYFVIMDFVDGTSLGKLVLAEGPLAEKDVVEYAKMLCDILAYLHSVRDNPIIYRDIKPDNIMLTQAGRIKLIDFGIAKEYSPGEKETGESIGTKGYAAPEQYKGASNILDQRTDIYSFGATLFYLVTGSVPGKPPKGVPYVRQINPLISEGLEYIISKCTRDLPEERYQNCRELRKDLNNIKKLSAPYRRKMVKKFVLFVASLSVSVLFGGLSWKGYEGMQIQKEGSFQSAFQTATAYEREKDYNNAALYYSQAIEYKPEDYETYLLFFNTLLPFQADEDFNIKTKSAIDEMRKRYLDNKTSVMYHNPELMYQIVKKCIEVNDPVYAAYAVDYIESIKESDNYNNGAFSTEDIDSYHVIASNCSKNVMTQDFESFNEALVRLEESTDNQSLSADDKLNNYYTIMTMYNTYPANLKDSYNKIYEIGLKAKLIIYENTQSETLNFNNIIPMHEMVASGLYNHALTPEYAAQKEELFKKSIEWFEYLEDINDELAEGLELKKANAYKGVFDTYNTAGGLYRIDAEIQGYLDKAISIYEDVVRKYSGSFLAHVYLTQAYMDKELIKPQEERDFTAVWESYARVMTLKEHNKGLSSVALSQYASLKRLMLNAGLEVS